MATSRLIPQGQRGWLPHITAYSPVKRPGTGGDDEEQTIENRSAVTCSGVSLVSNGGDIVYC